jgi:tetratricopeptide (TPR) repeat protein
MLAVLLALPGQNAQETYQRGLVQEQAAGDLKRAIELYLEAAKEAGKDRALAAKALIRAAGSEEKLGQPEAATLYAEVLRTYPEQRDQAVVAQTRLAALSQGTGGSSHTDVSAVFGPLIQEYCVDCHNQTRKGGALPLDSLNTKNVGENTATW